MRHSFRVFTTGEGKLCLLVDSLLATGSPIHWRLALDFARELKLVAYAAHKTSETAWPSESKGAFWHLRAESFGVLMFLGGALRFGEPVPYPHAIKIAGHIRAVAKLAEEQAKAVAVAFDAAIFQRAGVPVGLSSDPKIQDLQGNIAAWDRDLRRYMPGGVKSQARFGKPALIDHNQRKRDHESIRVALNG